MQLRVYPLLFLMLSSFADAEETTTPKYRIVELGSPPNTLPTESYGFELNESAYIVGGDGVFILNKPVAWGPDGGKRGRSEPPPV